MRREKKTCDNLRRRRRRRCAPGYLRRDGGPRAEALTQLHRRNAELPINLRSFCFVFFAFFFSFALCSFAVRSSPIRPDNLLFSFRTDPALRGARQYFGMARRRSTPVAGKFSSYARRPGGAEIVPGTDETITRQTIRIDEKYAGEKIRIPVTH